MPIQKILIVDDSPTERYFLTDVLVKNGFSVSNTAYFVYCNGKSDVEPQNSSSKIFDNKFNFDNT
mgnify:CR=1 FL=1